jgi:hypothetical protein
MCIFCPSDPLGILENEYTLPGSVALHISIVDALSLAINIEDEGNFNLLRNDTTSLV